MRGLTFFGLLCSLSDLIMPCICQTCDNIDTDILILGGGMAGVTAANEFQQKGIDFILVEAQKKLGGRIRNLEITPGIFVTEGASFIHGIDLDPNNRNMHPLYNLTEKCGKLEGVVLNSDAEDLIKVYNSSGSDMTEAFFERASAYINAFSAAQYYSRIRQAQNLEDQSCRDGLNAGSWVVRTPLDNFTDWEEFEFCVAESPDISSLYGDIEFDTYRDFNSKRTQPFITSRTDYFITDNRGFLHLVNCLAESFQNDPNRVRLNSLVTKIYNMENCVCITTSNGNLCGRYAILTFSIGVIKSTNFQHYVLTPAFSAKKLQALEIMTMAHYLKIILVFERRFWDTDVFFIGYVSEVRGYYPFFNSLHHVQSLNAITFTVTGDMALRVLNQPESTTQEEIMAVLRDIYNTSIPNPTRIYLERFSTDPLFLGSYSNIRVGLTRDTFSDLNSPEGRLYFAGEGFSEKYGGFVHGAYLTGIETAETLMGVINRAHGFYIDLFILLLDLSAFFFLSSYK